MPSGHAALLRRHGGYLLAMLWSSTDGKLWAIGGDGKPFRLSRPQVVWETDLPLDDPRAPGWVHECEALAPAVDLGEVWQVVQGEVPWLSLADLGELVWGQALDGPRTGALLLALHAGPVSYFSVQDRTLVPRAPDDIESQLLRQEKARQAAGEEESFLHWLEGVAEAPEWSPRLRDWLEAVRRYAIHGESSPTARQARKLLRSVQPDASDRLRVAFEALVRLGVFHEDEPLGLHRLGVPLSFPQEVLDEAERLAAVPLSAEGRRDLASLEVFTIDEATTADMDDALSVQAAGDGYEIGIHITDAASLVPAGGEVDIEARGRVSSLYLPERVIPMLPPSLSTGAGSLAPGVRRATLSLLVRVDGEGRIVEWEATPSVVESSAKLSYEEADAALADLGHPRSESLRALERVANGWREERLASGALEMDRPEVKVTVDAEGRVEVSVVERPTASRRLVAEFMILANRLFGEFCRDQGIPSIYRTQDPVSMEGLAETSVAPVRQYQILRRIRAASVSGSPGPHALLGLPVYAQSTSPLRRYTDLVVQRQVAHFLRHGVPLYDVDEVEEIVHQAREQLRDLARAEGDRRQHWLLRFLSACIGEAFPAVVLEIRDRHALLELERLMLRTTVYLGPVAAVGDTVPLRLQEVDLWRRQAFFTYEPDRASVSSEGVSP